MSSRKPCKLEPIFRCPLSRRSFRYPFCDASLRIVRRIQARVEAATLMNGVRTAIPRMRSRVVSIASRDSEVGSVTVEGTFRRPGICGVPPFYMW